jgi:hypothetical protein
MRCLSAPPARSERLAASGCVCCDAAAQVDIWQQLRHPCVCTLLGVSTFDGRPSMVLEYMTGVSLHDLLHNTDKRAPIEIGLLSRIVAEVTRARAPPAERAHAHRISLGARSRFHVGATRRRSPRADRPAASDSPDPSRVMAMPTYAGRVRRRLLTCQRCDASRRQVGQCAPPRASQPQHDLKFPSCAWPSLRLPRWLWPTCVSVRWCGHALRVSVCDGAATRSCSL